MTTLRNKSLSSQSGISLVELMLAMTVFTFMLMIIVKGVISVVRVQQAGVVSRNTQQNARLTMEQIVREARGATDARVIASGSPQFSTVCLVTAGGLIEYYVSGNRVYRATVDYNSGFNPASGTNTCITTPTPSYSSNVALTSPDVAVVNFTGSVTPTPPSSGPPATPPDLSLKLRISTNPLVTNVCSPGAGSQFCSVTELNSTVSLRGTP